MFWLERYGGGRKRERRLASKSQRLRIRIRIRRCISAVNNTCFFTNYIFNKNKLSTFKILVTYAFMLLAEDTKKKSLGLS